MKAGVVKKGGRILKIPQMNNCVFLPTCLPDSHTGKMMHEVKPEQAIVDALEGLLEKAKTGDISGIAFVLTYHGEYTANGWAGMGKINIGVIGELRILERDLIDLLVDLRVDPETGERRD